jgi:polyhydroxyalkanoate synthesis regulator phasin
MRKGKTARYNSLDPKSRKLSMSNPLIQAFFVGRAVAETLNQQAESALANLISELGKFDAEQRENLRQFTEQVLERARREEELSMQGRTSTYTSPYSSMPNQDLQAMIDELRAEVAELRAELQRYRINRSV